jgi:hypothetical protein
VSEVLTVQQLLTALAAAAACSKLQSVPAVVMPVLLLLLLLPLLLQLAPFLARLHLLQQKLTCYCWPHHHYWY